MLIDLAARGGDPLWALVFSRATSAALTAAVAIGRFDRSRFPVRIVVAAGLFDVGGNALYVVARESIPIGLAAALTGLYPIVTMILARFVLGERLPRLGPARRRARPARDRPHLGRRIGPRSTADGVR